MTTPATAIGRQGREREDGLGLGLLLTLALLAGFSPVATDLYLPGFAALSSDLGVDASGAQLTLTAILLGMALGQLVTGPLSDRYGRRGPLLASAAVCVAAGAVTAVAPSLAVLVAARFVQGASGAGGVVIGRAVIADLFTGRAAAQAFTLMMTVGGAAPVLAPLVGSVLADPIGWRGMLWFVTGLCVVMLVAVVAAVPETRPRATRAAAPTTSYAASMRGVLGHRGYRADVAVFSFSFGMMMAYIAASPFLYQDVLGLSQIGYGLAFGVNACGLIATGYLVSRLVERADPRRVVGGCLVVQVAATLALLLLTGLGAPATTYAVAIFVAVGTNGGVMGAAAALAMGHVRESAGMGSAWLGFTQFSVGAVVAPLVGLGGRTSTVVPALVMAGCSLVAGAAWLLAARLARRPVGAP